MHIHDIIVAIHIIRSYDVNIHIYVNESYYVKTCTWVELLHLLVVNVDMNISCDVNFHMHKDWHGVNMHNCYEWKEMWIFSPVYVIRNDVMQTMCTFLHKVCVLQKNQVPKIASIMLITTRHYKYHKWIWTFTLSQ